MIYAGTKRWNQWGWGGFTTHDLHRCQLSARAVALIYNWWSLFVRLANPEARLEAMTSRPWLMSSVFCRWLVPRYEFATSASDATCAGRTFDGPDPKRPSAGSRSAG